MRSLGILALLLLLPFTGARAQEEVVGLRLWPAPDNTRVVFDLSGPIKHNLFTLSDPARVVIDIKDARMAQALDGNNSSDLLGGIRAAVRNKDDLRVVLDLKKKARPKSFVLRPNERYGHRLVIDLEEAGAAPKPVRSLAQLGRARDVVIAVDAGHGGEDPGASGPSGVQEKHVVLAIARRLQRLIDREPGMRAVMIRDGDYYIGLNKRVEKARQQHADLFVSIHADAFRDHRARGSSVYILSRSGSSSEHARLLAAKENAADLVGGVSLDDKDDLLASVLLDLSQTATNEASYEVADEILGRMKRVNRLHKRGVERAAFRVLKAPDIPSLLVETAFISNPREERALNDQHHQQKLAEALLEGLRDYFKDNSPPGTLLAEQRNRRHVIARGDTLLGIARRYHVSMEALQQQNGLQTTELQVGQILHIPLSGS